MCFQYLIFDICLGIYKQYMRQTMNSANYSNYSYCVFVLPAI